MKPTTVTLSRLDAAALIREARASAGITQAELADRLRTKQSVISRWERGVDVPRVDSLSRILQACELEADVRFRRHDEVDRSQIVRMLQLTPRERVRHFQTVVEAARQANRAERVPA